MIIVMTVIIMIIITSIITIIAIRGKVPAV